MKSAFVEKNWYTLEAAADRLASRFKEFNESDLLQLAVEGRLKLSVVFSDRVQADLFKQIREDELSYAELPSLSGNGIVRIPNGGAVVYDHFQKPYQATGQRLGLVE